MVFQLESPSQLGEYTNNLGQGMGYDGLSGLFAIEFDTFARVHENQALISQLEISIQKINDNVKLLSSDSSSTIRSNKKPLNFAVKL